MKKLIFRKIITDITLFFLLLSLILGLIVWTLQAVNYLDYVTQDGHGLKTYFLYTLFTFPKIIHRISPFVFFISLFVIIINYETKNELLIFWTNGINKIQFANKLIFLSIILLLFQIFIGSLVSPFFQYKARTFLKDSNINYFTSLIKEGKFINAVDGLTIFIQSKNNDNSFTNIFIDDSSKSNTKMISANYGKIVNQNNQKVFKLYSGEVINKDNFNSEINFFKFDQIDFGLSNFSTNTILVHKIQEVPSLSLASCFFELRNKKSYELRDEFFKCESSIKEDVTQEMFKRFYKPFYIPAIAIICSFLIILPKNSIYYSRNRKLIFIGGFTMLVISETILRYSAISDTSIIIYLSIPWVIFISIYLFFHNKVKHV